MMNTEEHKALIEMVKLGPLAFPVFEMEARTVLVDVLRLHNVIDDNPGHELCRGCSGPGDQFCLSPHPCSTFQVIMRKLEERAGSIEEADDSLCVKFSNVVCDVLNLHAPDPRFAQGWCMHCCVDMPCPTVERIMAGYGFDSRLAPYRR